MEKQVSRKRKIQKRDITSRMDAAENHPRILEMKTVDVMQRFKLSHRRAKEVKDRVYTRLLVNGHTDRIERAEESKKKSRLYKSLIRTERKYPRFLRKSFEAKFYSHVAEEYELTRQRAHQLRTMCEEYIELTGATASALFDDIESHV